MHIRQATKSDLPAILALVRELAIYEKEEHSLTATLSDYESAFDDNIFEALVLEHPEHDIIGIALYYMTYSTWKGRMLYLEDFIVTESFRKQGCGDLLFDALKKKAQEKAAKLIKWQVLDWNTPAIRFYQKQQAIIEKDWWNGKLFVDNVN